MVFEHALSIVTDNPIHNEAYTDCAQIFTVVAPLTVIFVTLPSQSAYCTIQSTTPAFVISYASQFVW